jgi:hypothetical protein
MAWRWGFFFLFSGGFLVLFVFLGVFVPGWLDLAGYPSPFFSVSDGALVVGLTSLVYVTLDY